MSKYIGAQMLEFTQKGDDRGHLVIIEGMDDIPFDIKRIFYIYGSDANVIRGQHANKKSEFLLINVAGTSKVRIKDGKGNEAIFLLNRPHTGIYLPKMIWKDMYDFSKDSVLLCLSSEHYDPDEYIRNYDEFIDLVNREGNTMKHSYCAKLDDILIRPIKRSDIELLRNWRNDKRNSEFLRNIGHITSEMQESWYEAYLKNEEDLVFAIEDHELNRVVGSLSLYDWNRKENTCKIGKIQIGDPAAHGKGIGRKTLVMAMKIAYKKIHIEKILASVHPDNIQAYKNDMKIGFVVTGEIDSVAGGKELTLEMTEETTLNTNSYYEDIELFEMDDA